MDQNNGIKRKKLLQFGAGNIGRSFLGQVFSLAGYEIVFIDINELLVSELNKKRYYKVILKDNDTSDKEIIVRNVRAVDAKDIKSIISEIITADLISTSVGKGALKKIIPIISSGLRERQVKYPDSTIDIIIAENIRNGAEFFRNELCINFPKDFPLDQYIGLIETSIGKMVPIMGDKDVAKDPLWVFSEPYNQLILDSRNLKNPLPVTNSIKQVDNIAAYVDRKLFIHNLGHAAAAYIGYLGDPSLLYIYQVFEDRKMVHKVRACMTEAASALCREYPMEFTIGDLLIHVDDLISRFQNKALGDTIFRVGRDLSRKLEKNDRLIGAVLLCRKYNLPCENILIAAASGFFFKARDEKNKMFKPDILFFQDFDTNGIDSVLREICHLSKQYSVEAEVIDSISLIYNKLKIKD